jgi:DNA-binding response OmpR family regulator
MKKILIVDDDAELRANLSEILKNKGYETYEAFSGEEAIKKTETKDFDVILLDLMMPGISGMDVLMELRKVKPKTKIIMITAFATIDNAVEAIKKGASDYISKPFKVAELDATIRQVIEEAKFDMRAEKLDLDYTISSLSNPIRRKIIKLLHHNKGMRLMELTRALGIEDHTKVIFHLRMLRDSKIIEQDEAKTYLLTKEGEKTLKSLKIFESHLST